MQRVCFTQQMKKDMIEQYKAEHQVWPEMLQALADAGFENYSLFVNEDGLMIGYFESEDPMGSLAKIGETEVNTRWQANMAKFFESGSGDMRNSGMKWIPMVFHFD